MALTTASTLHLRRRRLFQSSLCEGGKATWIRLRVRFTARRGIEGHRHAHIASSVTLASSRWAEFPMRGVPCWYDRPRLRPERGAPICCLNLRPDCRRGAARVGGSTRKGEANQRPSCRLRSVCQALGLLRGRRSLFARPRALSADDFSPDGFDIVPINARICCVQIAEVGYT